MRFSHDAEADAIYITLREMPYKWGEDLDHRRRIDFGEDDRPIGIELLSVSKGIDLNDLPERATIARLLAEHGFHVLAPTR